MLFSGQAKTRGVEDAKTEYTIPTLFRADLMREAITYLVGQDRRLDPELQKKNTTNKAFGMALSRAMDKYKGISCYNFHQ